MSAIETGSITTEWYRPWSEERPLVSNLQLGRVRVLTGFYGVHTLDLCRKLMAGATFSRKDAEAIDRYFFQSSKQIYHLPKQTDPQEFYLQQNKGAIGVVRHFGKLVPELAGEWEMKDEINDLSDRPSDLLRLIACPPEKIDPVLVYEAQRHATLVYQVGMINARTLNGRLRTVLSDVNRLLNKRLFRGSEGYGEKIVVESFHDDETNEVVGFPDRNDRRPLTAHLKRVPLTVRWTQEMGVVRTGSRKKDDSVALVKSWVKALDNGGVIQMNDAIQDSIGREFVLMDDSIPPEQFADVVVSIIEAEAGVRSDLWEIPKIVKVEKDDRPNADRGQSSKPPFDARRQIWFVGIPTPIELKFFSRETYLNAELEVGTRDPETGLYEGRSHDLYDLRKHRRAVPVLFNQKVYPVEDHVVNTGFVSRSKQIAFGLRNMHKAA